MDYFMRLSNLSIGHDAICIVMDWLETKYVIMENMCSNSKYSIWFMQHETLKSFDLTEIDDKALVMSLTFILETYLRFQGRKWCKFNHFRFWKIKKGLNEEISESRLMDYEERQDEDIMSLGDE